MPGDERIGELVAHDRIARTIDIRKGPTKADVHPSAVFQCDGHTRRRCSRKRLLRFCGRPRRDDPAARTSCSGGRPACARGDFAPPRRRERSTDFAVRLATDLDRTTLAIQGPPGAGKTYVGAQMIRALVGAGKKVGVTAVSHKVIRNLLDAVLEQAEDRGWRDVSVRLGRNVAAEDSTTNRGRTLATPCEYVSTKAEPALAALASARCDVLGGTVVALVARRGAGDRGRAVRGRSRPDVAGERARRLGRGRQPGAARRSAAARTAAEGQPSRRRRRLRAGARARRRRDDAAGPRPLPADHVAASPRDLRLHLGGVLRGQAAAEARTGAPAPDGHRRLRRRRACGGCPSRTTATRTRRSRKSTPSSASSNICWLRRRSSGAGLQPCLDDEDGRLVRCCQRISWSSPPTTRR